MALNLCLLLLIVVKKELNINCFGSRPYYAGEIYNPALFLWLGLPSTLIRHENRGFRRYLKTPALWTEYNLVPRVLSLPTSKREDHGNEVGRNTLQNRLRHDNHVVPQPRSQGPLSRTVITRMVPCPRFPQRQIENERWLLGFKIFRCNEDGKHLMRLNSENAVLIFLRRSLDEAL